MRIRRNRRALGLCCALLLALCALPALAQGPEPGRDLRSALEERFEILALRDGVVLQPRDETASPRSIEVGSDGIFLDGAPAGEDEIGVRLGDETAALVLRLKELDAGQLRQLAAGGSSDGENTAAAEAAAAEEIREEARREAAEEAERAAEELDEREESAHEERDRLRDERDDQRVKRRVKRDTQVVIANSQTIEEDEISDDVLVMGARCGSTARSTAMPWPWAVP
ncbi:MAG: hypothetical protein R2991_13335 [Thermoanaerobaculia bacterium]